MFSLTSFDANRTVFKNIKSERYLKKYMQHYRTIFSYIILNYENVKRYIQRDARIDTREMHKGAKKYLPLDLI